MEGFPIMTDERQAALLRLQTGLDYHFQDIGLLDNALTHRSFVNENPTPEARDNERLEFLGDAVLELCISDMLMKKFPEYTEGQLSQLRASVVNEQPLAELAKSLRIGDYLLLGKGEEASGGRQKNSLLSNTFEALMAAIYLDGGFAKASEYIGQLFEFLIDEGLKQFMYRDYKTTVQQLSQSRFREFPRYSLISESGPDHDKTFEIQLSIADQITTIGAGKNKKEAEQQAAEKALRLLQESAPSDHGTA
jgi:ribonuclease III